MNKVLLSGNEAIARGAYEAGVQIATGYPGTPSSEILATIAKKYKDEIYAEWSTNEKVAMDVAAGAAYSGRRTIVTTKQVGMNVLSDALLYTVYTGTEGGLVVITADDPGMFSSQNEQDNRWYAKLAKIPLLEPADSQEAKDFVVLGIGLSEEFDTPVLIRTTMRVSHSKSIVLEGERPSVPQEVGPFVRDQQKYVCTAMWAKKRHPVVEQRLVSLARYAEDAPCNHVEWAEHSLGIITSGVTYTYAREVFPQASFLKLGMTFPLPEELIRSFANGVEKLIVIEELDPFLEEQIRAMGINVIGKEIFPPYDELLPDRLTQLALESGLIDEAKGMTHSVTVPTELPARTPVLCAGCPHRSTYYWLDKMKMPVAGDIGCYNLGCLPPFNAQHTMGCMGASVGVLHGMSIAGVPEHAVATIGDSTFFHSGMPALLNMVHNQSRGVVIIMDNGTTAMTGHQDNPGTDWTLQGKDAPHVELEPLVCAMGVEKVLTVNAFDIGEVERGLKECLAYDGPSVLITKGLCAQLDRTPKTSYMVNPDKCIACGACLKLGCPAIVKADKVDEKTGEPKAEIDPGLCVGCDICRQVCPVEAIQISKGRESQGER
ncbi:MAG: indolepyruvate ferredoxin oxidoreductase subunit alpha [Candidatus Bipolaricaulota bacterium]